VRKTILTIAGSDSSGGAGIQADLKSIAANGGYGASVITAITAQNTREVIAAETVNLALLQAQLRAVFDDLDIAAVKTGMLGTREVVEMVANELQRRHVPALVVDPVMISKSGHVLLAAEAIEALRQRLFPLASLVTPNVEEASALSGIAIETIEDATRAGRNIIEDGAAAALVKGGHLRSNPATDVLVTKEGVRTFAGEWIETPHTHGTGCTYSAAIATHLGAGLPLEEAIMKAKQFLTEAIRAAVAVGRGRGPTDPFFFLRDENRA
jgi:hydroxymethylpyrimidine/phosphomethylpyrimidine kinase